MDAGRCPQHQRQHQREADRRRGSARKRGYSYAWEQASKAFLADHPLCVYCERQGHLTPSRCVDHATPHKGDHDLFWSRQNWRAACIECNSAKGDDDEPTFLARLEHYGRLARAPA